MKFNHLIAATAFRGHRRPRPRAIGARGFCRGSRRTPWRIGSRTGKAMARSAKVDKAQGKLTLRHGPWRTSPCRA